MAKSIALFNNKGGVSKTTTTFNLGWMLSLLGKRTLIVDTDPQCNLTGLCLDSDKHMKFDKLYASNISNIKISLSPVFEGEPRPLSAATCYCFEDNKKLYLLPGHIDFSTYDSTYNIAENLTGSLSLMRNVPGALRYVLNTTADKYDIDYILLDMSPSISATNANILMQSDYFFVPCAPDYFCYMAIKSLSKVLEKWNKTYRKLSTNEIFEKADYKLKNDPPKFLGTIQQRYRPRNGTPSKAFSKWIFQINDAVIHKLVPELKKDHMMLNSYDPSCFENPYNLTNIADFNSLIAQSQIHNTPVFLLTKDQVEASGSVWTIMKSNIDDFYTVFEHLAKSIIKLTA